MDIQIRTITEGEFDLWSRAEALGFADHATDEYVRIERSMAELDRSFGAFDGDRTVGTTTTRSSSMTIPGGSESLGFVDNVTVLPTHRRRGIMTQLISAQLRQIHERGETLSALTASESLIYERFGYGVATWADYWTIQRTHTEFKVPPDAGGRLEFVGADAARDEWPRLHARVAQERSGMVHYGVDYWRACLADEEFQRRGASEFFHVAYLRNGGVSGLVTYRIREHTVLTVFLLGEDAEVEAELWRYCFGIDLMNEVRTFNQPTDDPLPWRLVDPRQLRRSTRDHMWLRLVDVRRALAARKYDGEGVVVLKVLDDFCEWNEGVYRLETGPDGAKCSRTTTSADLELTAAELAAVYLGGNTFSTLARAGRVREQTKGTLYAADRLFRTPRQPWSLEL